MSLVRLAGIVVLFLTVGCENMGNLFPVYKSIPYKDTFQNYVGRDYREVELDAGPSDAISETSDGNKIFIYKYSRSEGSGVRCVTRYKQDKTSYQECYGQERITSHCNVYYTTDASQIIRSMDFRGRACSNLIRVEVTDPEEIAEIRRKKEEEQKGAQGVRKRLQ